MNCLDPEKPGKHVFWKDVRYYYDGTTAMYVCKSVIHKASTSEGNLWRIWKHTFDVSGNVTRTQGPIIGNSDDYLSMDW